MATLTEQTFDEGGTDLTLDAAAGGGDQFANTGKQLLIISNGSGSSITVTITAQQTSFEDKEMGNAVKEDQTLAVAAGSVGIMGPFSRRAFDDSSGNVQVGYSSATSVEVAVIRND